MSLIGISHTYIVRSVRKYFPEIPEEKHNKRLTDENPVKNLMLKWDNIESFWM